REQGGTSLHSGTSSADGAARAAGNASPAVIEDQVDPRTRHEWCEPLQELHRREDEMGRPVGPRPLEGDGDPPVAQPVQPALSERRSAEVLAESLEPLAIARGDVHGGMEIEAVVVSMERHVAVDPWSVGVGADPHGPPSRATAQGGPTED